MSLWADCVSERKVVQFAFSCQVLQATILIPCGLKKTTVYNLQPKQLEAVTNRKTLRK